MLILETPWASQPRGQFILNRKGRFADGLAAVYCPSLSFFSELLYGGITTGSRTYYPAPGVGRLGVALKYDGAQVSPLHAIPGQAPSDLTTMVVVVPKRTDRTGHLFGIGDSTLLYASGIRENAGTFRGRGYTNSGTVVNGGTSYSVDTPYVVVVTERKSPAALNIYVNGLVDASPTTGFSQISSTVVNVGAPYSSLQRSSELYLGVCWRRVLSADEVWNLSQNPWQLFQRRIWVPVSAGSAASYTLTAGAGSYSLSGQAALLKASRKVVAGAGSYSLTGNAAGIYRGLRLVAGAGTYSWSGQAANVRAQRKLVAAAATYALTGNAAVLRLGRMLAMASGSYSFTGQAIGLTKTGSSSLAAGTGSYALTGQSAGVLATRKLTAGAGSFSLSGQAAILRLSRRLAAGTGSFALTGQDVALRTARRLSAGAGVFNLTGSAAQLLRGYRLAATAGTYALTGNAAVLAKTGSYSLTAGAGTYAWTGIGATLTYSGEIFTDSEFWKYTVPAQPLLFTVPAQDLRFTVPANPLGFTI